MISFLGETLAIIGHVLLSWLHFIGTYLKEVSVFGYRLLTNKVGLPKWLWIVMLVSALFSAVVYLLTGR